MSIRQRLDRVPPAVLFLGLFAALCLVSLPLANRFYTNALVDIGEYLNNAYRLLDGQLPYRDFWLFHPAGEVLLPSWLYRLVGPSIAPVLIMNVLLNVLAGACSFIFARQLLKENGPALLTALLVFFNGVPTESGMAVSLQTGQYFLFLVLAMMAFIRALETDRELFLLLSGLGVGCAFALRVFDTGPGCIAMAASIAMHWGLRRSARRLGVFAIGVVAVWFLVSLAVWPAGWLMLRDTTVTALAHHFRFFHGVQFLSPLTEEWRAVLERVRAVAASGQLVDAAKLAFRTFALVNSLTLYLVPVIVGAAAMRSFRRRALTKTERTMAVALLVWGFLTLLKGMKYPALYYWVAGTTPLLFLLIFFRERVGTHGTMGWRLLLTGTIGVLALSIPAGLAVSPFRVATVRERIVGPRGFLMVEDAGYAREVRQVMALILRESRPGDYIFIDAYHIPPLYVMTGRRNATRYDSLQDVFADQLAGLPTEPEEAQICQELLSKETKVVVTEQRKRSNQYRVLQQCIESHFLLAGQCGGYDVYTSLR